MYDSSCIEFVLFCDIKSILRRSGHVRTLSVAIVPHAVIMEPTSSELWALSFGYPSLSSAAPAYEAARDIIFDDAVNLDASVYRAYVQGMPQVVIVGIGPIKIDLQKRLFAACMPGVLTHLPDEVFVALLLRHAEQRSFGAKVERRAGEPPRIDPL